MKRKEEKMEKIKDRREIYRGSSVRLKRKQGEMCKAFKRSMANGVCDALQDAYQAAECDHHPPVQI